MATDRGNSKTADSATGQDDNGSQSTPAGGGCKSFFAKNWLLLVFMVLISLIQGGAVAYHRAHLPTFFEPASTASPEVALGAFHFEADKSEGGHATRADFSLYVTLVEPGERAARQRLAEHKFRVQQAVEELLRKAHGGDFDDPSLQDLKRQLHEQINQTVGMRAISDVILTDVKLVRNGSGAKAPIASTAESAPWHEAGGK